MDWIVRATHIAEDQYKKAGLTDWVAAQALRKERLRQRIAQCDDDRWSKAVLDWEPFGWRTVGRPCSRWTDSFA